MAVPPSQLIVERRGDVAIIRLNAPGSLNAFTPAMFEELTAAFRECARGSRVILLTSVGRAFSSGINLGGGEAEAPEDAGELLDTHVNPLIMTLKDLGIPWIAAVRGPVVGVACSIALAADMIVASDTAYFFLAFARIGLIPDGGATWLLTRALGRARAMELMLLGDRLPAETALQWGLVNRVVPDAALDEAGLALAARLAAGPTLAYGLIRALSWSAATQDLEQMLAAERTAQRRAGLSADAAEGRAAYADKRQPSFSGQ